MPALDVRSGMLGPRETHYLASRLKFRQLSETKLNQANSSKPSPALWHFQLPRCDYSHYDQFPSTNMEESWAATDPVST